MIIDVLLGRHGYSLTPEEETGWTRVCLLIGFIGGVAAAAALIGAVH